MTDKNDSKDSSKESKGVNPLTTDTTAADQAAGKLEFMPSSDLGMNSDALLASLSSLIDAFDRKGDEFAGVLKMGRTQLQDAVPMTLGQEFNTFAIMLGEHEARLTEALQLILEINLGGTAIGTGITTERFGN